MPFPLTIRILIYTLCLLSGNLYPFVKLFLSHCPSHFTLCLFFYSLPTFTPKDEAITSMTKCDVAPGLSHITALNGFSSAV